MTSVEQLANLIKHIKDENEPFIVLISGASGSGKTTEARKLVKLLDSLGVPVVRYRGEPFYIEMDMFYRDNTGEISSVLGGNFDHPFEIDAFEVEKVLDDLIEGNEVYLPLYSFKEARQVGKLGPVVPDRNAVIVVEGIYTIGLLSHRSNLNVFVEARSKMELFARRLLRDVERTGREGEKILVNALTAMSMWNIYGEEQKYMSDIILRSSYSILEDKGTPSYQIKVEDSTFEKEMPSTARKLFSSEALKVEDLVIGDVEEKMRGRLIFQGIMPERFELSYRTLIPNDLPFTKSLKVSLKPHGYTAFVQMSQIMGYHPRIYYREIHLIREGDTLFKWYPERGIVEVETTSEGSIEKYVDRFKGSLRFKSYYSE